METKTSDPNLAHLLTGPGADRTGYRFYEEPIRNLLEAMDQGVCPWNNPCLTWPIANAKTRLTYRGFNQFSLATATMIAGYRSPYWLTLIQANEFGGSIRKGSRSTMIVFRKVFESGGQETNERPKAQPGSDQSQRRDEDPAKVRKFTRLFYFRAFNFDQTENVDIGVDPHPTVQRPNVQDGSENAAQRIVAGFKDGPKIEHRQSIVDRAAGSYSEDRDVVSLRPPEDYVTAGEYWSALFHELIHSCGAANRLDFRKGAPQARFGDKDYALEELTCEIGANLLLSRAGLENEALRANSAAYLRSWRKKIGENPRLVIGATDRAVRAVNLVLGIVPMAATADPVKDSASPSGMALPNPMPLPSVEVMARELAAEPIAVRRSLEPSIDG